MCIYIYSVSQQQWNETLENLSLKRNPETMWFLFFLNQLSLLPHRSCKFQYILLFFKLVKGKLRLSNKEQNSYNNWFQNLFIDSRSERNLIRNLVYLELISRE